MKRQYLKIFILLICSSYSCQSGSRIDYKTVSKHLCTCSDELYKRNKNFEDFVNLKKQDKAISLMDSIEVEEEKFQSCILDDNKKHKIFDDKDIATHMSKSLKSICPEKEKLIMKVIEDTRLKQN
jgi:hypothetical protein